MKHRISQTRYFHAKRTTAMPRFGAGFTLLETVIAVGIFTVIMVIVVGAMVEVTKAQEKADKIREIQDNLRFSLESMTREIRTGSTFVLASPIVTIAGNDGGYSGPLYGSLAFTTQTGVQIGYCFDAAAFSIRKFAGTSSVCDSSISQVTSPILTIDRLGFFVIGQLPGPSDGQPRVTVIIKAQSKDPILKTTMNIQTTVTQRLRDL